MPEPKIETRQAQHYAFIECDAVDGDVGRVAPPLIGELAGWLGKKGISPAGAPFFNYTAMGPEAMLHIEVAFPVAGAPKPEGRFRAGVLPAGRYAVLKHVGPYDQLKKVNMRKRPAVPPCFA